MLNEYPITQRIIPKKTASSAMLVAELTASTFTSIERKIEKIVTRPIAEAIMPIGMANVNKVTLKGTLHNRCNMSAVTRVGINTIAKLTGSKKRSMSGKLSPITETTKINIFLSRHWLGLILSGVVLFFTERMIRG